MIIYLGLGGTAGDYSGRSVSAAGDVNNDGYDDIIIGADLASPSSRIYAGESYVIYGSGSISEDSRFCDDKVVI